MAKSGKTGGMRMRRIRETRTVEISGGFGHGQRTEARVYDIEDGADMPANAVEVAGGDSGVPLQDWKPVVVVPAGGERLAPGVIIGRQVPGAIQTGGGD